MKNTSGFTLVELSIVIVVIGLLVAGVVAGQSLVKQAQLRQVSSILFNVETAVNNFKLQYDALPGDIDNAYDYWNSVLTCSTDNTTNTSGCNGDGDGIIETTAALQEGYRAWEQMSYLGLMSGSFTGNYTTGLVCDQNITVPKAFDIGGLDLNNSGTTTFARVGAIGSSGGCIVDLFTTSEAKSVDNKMDDGLAGSGRLLSAEGLGSSDSCLSGGNYLLTSTTRSCLLEYTL